MKKIIKGLLIAVVVLLLVMYLPYYLNVCNDCSEFFVGAGYESNIVTELISENEPVICKECAEMQHVLSLALGKPLSDFARPAFVDPVTMFCERFEIK